MPPIPTSNEHNGNVASSDINPDDDANQEHDPKNDVSDSRNPKYIIQSTAVSADREVLRIYIVKLRDNPSQIYNP